MTAAVTNNTNDELLDLVNDKDEIIGSVWKSEAHTNPKLIHREVAIAIFTKKGEVLLQQRSMKKETGPGEWKTSCAGHTGKGETPDHAIKREVNEELGLEIEPVFFKKIFSKYKDKESRFFYVYYTLLQDRQPVKIDKEEVMNTKWIKITKLEEFAGTHEYDLTGTSHKIILEASEKIL